MNPTAAQVADIQAVIERITDAAPTIARHAREWTPGYPATTSTGHTSGGITDPIAERIATATVGYRTDHEGQPVLDDHGARIPLTTERDVAQDAHRWCNDWHTAFRMLLALEAQVTRLAPSQLPAEEDATQISACDCCGRPIACTRADPRRNGLCGKCAKSWERAANAYVDWRRQRRLMLGIQLAG